MVDTSIGGLWDVIGPMAAAAFVTSLLYVCGKGGKRVAQQAIPDWSWPPSLHRRLALLSVAFAYASAADARALPDRVPGARKSQSAKPPWSGASGFPPPLPLVPTEGRVRAVHPAIHGRIESPRALSPLFPREQPRRLEGSPPPIGAEPTGNGTRGKPSHEKRPPTADKGERGSAPRLRRYVVRRGDTLWDIAARVLITDSPRRIARYWPKIHRANRVVIGPNPDLIRPGQVLELPEEASS